MRDNRIDQKTIFSQAPERKEVFIKKMKKNHQSRSKGTPGTVSSFVWTIKGDQPFFPRPAVPAEADLGSTGSKVYYLPVPDSTDDKDSFYYILHQQHEKNKWGIQFWNHNRKHRVSGRLGTYRAAILGNHQQLPERIMAYFVHILFTHAFVVKTFFFLLRSAARYVILKIQKGKP